MHLTAANIVFLIEAHQNASLQWHHLEWNDDTIIEPDSLCFKAWVCTKNLYTGPIEITLIAKMEQGHMRVDAYNGAGLIFNWPTNPKNLFVFRPDGKLNHSESGSGISLPVDFFPLSQNEWHAFRWYITPMDMKVFVNDRAVFSEKRTYDLSSPSKIALRAVGGPVKVQKLDVKPSDS